MSACTSKATFNVEAGRGKTESFLVLDCTETADGHKNHSVLVANSTPKVLAMWVDEEEVKKK